MEDGDPTADSRKVGDDGDASREREREENDGDFARVVIKGSNLVVAGDNKETLLVLVVVAVLVVEMERMAIKGLGVWFVEYNLVAPTIVSLFQCFIPPPPFSLLSSPLLSLRYSP